MAYAEEEPRLVVGGAVIDKGRLLAARRSAPAALAGRWELPGGKVELGETPQQALVREFKEELGIVIEPLERVAGAWPLQAGLILHVWQAKLLRGEPYPLQDHDKILWLAVEEALDIEWLEPDRPAVAEVIKRLSGRKMN